MHKTQQTTELCKAFPNCMSTFHLNRQAKTKQVFKLLEFLEVEKFQFYICSDLEKVQFHQRFLKPLEQKKTQHIFQRNNRKNTNEISQSCTMDRILIFFQSLLSLLASVSDTRATQFTTETLERLFTNSLTVFNIGIDQVNQHYCLFD